MSDLRQAAQQALEDLQDANGMAYSEFSVKDLYGETITAIRAALAEPEHDTDCHQSGICQRSGYSISAPRRPLTDDEIDRQWADEWDGFVSFVEAECIVRWTEQRHGITGESK